MKTSFTIKIMAVLMAVLVLFSSTSFAIDVHLCNDKVWSISFFGEADACPMGQKKEIKETKKNHCCKHDKQKSKKKSTHSFSKKDCCSSQQIVIESNTDIQTAEKLSFEKQEIVIKLAVLSVLFVGNFQHSAPTVWTDDPPPLIERDLNTLFQVFRI